MLCFLICFHCYLGKGGKVQSSAQEDYTHRFMSIINLHHHKHTSTASCSFCFPSVFPMEGNARHFSTCLIMNRQTIGWTVIRICRDGVGSLWKQSIPKCLFYLQGSAFSHKVVCYTGALGRNIKGNSDNKGDEIVFKIASKHKTLEL